jgi:hypothetical protein
VLHLCRKRRLRTGCVTGQDAAENRFGIAGRAVPQDLVSTISRHADAEEAETLWKMGPSDRLQPRRGGAGATA